MARSIAPPTAGLDPGSLVLHLARSPVAVASQAAATAPAQQLKWSAPSISSNATNLCRVDWQVSEEHRSFDLSILERQVAAATDIQTLSMTGSNQPLASSHPERGVRKKSGIQWPWPATHDHLKFMARSFGHLKFDRVQGLSSILLPVPIFFDGRPSAGSWSEVMPGATAERVDSWTRPCASCVDAKFLSTATRARWISSRRIRANAAACLVLGEAKRDSNARA